MLSNIDICTSFIEKAKNIVVLTGAGISTESGIKDFRSKTGVYQLAPETILSLDYFYRHPKEFYQFAIENLYHPVAKPNRGHEILATWEEQEGYRILLPRTSMVCIKRPEAKMSLSFMEP